MKTTSPKVGGFSSYDNLDGVIRYLKNFEKRFWWLVKLCFVENIIFYFLSFINDKFLILFILLLKK